MGYSQDNARPVKQEGNVFSLDDKAPSSRYTPTTFKWKEKDGTEYQIFYHTITRGDRQGQTVCVIRKVSKKSGKPYWKEIPVEASRVKGGER